MKTTVIALIGLASIIAQQDGDCSDTDNDGDGWTVGDGDCDDTNADIHPGADEVCDGLDNNCDRTVDEGTLGTGEACSAQSCKAIQAEDTSAVSGSYWIQASTDSVPAATYCEMSMASGGWTKVNDLSEAEVNDLLGAPGQVLLKCSDDGTNYIQSPSTSQTWYWAASAPTQLGGTWIVNGTEQSCGTDSEYDDASCSTWWGYKCSNGGGGNNKLYPGVLDSPSAKYCADASSGHTNASFSICGDNNYRSYSIFVRTDD